MATEVESSGERNQTLARMETQLEAWSTRLDLFDAESRQAETPPDDPRRVSVDDLRARLEGVKTQLHAFGDPPNVDGHLDAFQSAIGSEWTAIETGIEELISGASRAG